MDDSDLFPCLLLLLTAVMSVNIVVEDESDSCFDVVVVDSIMLMTTTRTITAENKKLY